MGAAVALRDFVGSGQFRGSVLLAQEQGSPKEQGQPGKSRVAAAAAGLHGGLGLRLAHRSSQRALI